MAAFRYDPLGRRVASTEMGVTTVHVPWGERVVADYLVDDLGDLKLRRRSYWGDGVDQLLVYDWDPAGDGDPEERYHPLTDPQGTVHAVAEPGGLVVESYLYELDGGFTIFGTDTATPALRLVRVRPADDVAGRPLQTLEVVFSEPTQAGSGTIELRDATGVLIFDINAFGRSSDGRRWWAEIDPDLTPGAQYTFHLSGVEDLAGNRMAVVEPVVLDFAAPDPAVPLNLSVGEEGRVLAVVDGPDRLAFLSGVPLDPASVQASSVTVTRAGQPVPGTLSLLDTSGGGGDPAATWEGESPPLDPGRSDRLPPGAPRPRPRPPPHRPRGPPDPRPPERAPLHPPRRRRHPLVGAHRHPDPGRHPGRQRPPPPRPPLPPAPRPLRPPSPLVRARHPAVPRTRSLRPRRLPQPVPSLRV